MTQIDQLLELMRRLRDPQGGCPWDLQQSFATIAPYTIEEAYEVADAIERGQPEDLRSELGDLLFQVVFHAQMAAELGQFEFADVVTGIVEKMTRRHPHVFGDARIESVADQADAWEAMKASERGKADASALAGISRGLAEFPRAVKLQARAARVGFDWPAVDQVLAKLDEEWGELRREIDDGAPAERMEDELGDVLFVLANLARHLSLDPARALRRANAKFERRYRHMEQLAAAEQVDLSKLDLAAQDRYWERAKQADHAGLLDADGQRSDDPALQTPSP